MRIFQMLLNWAPGVFYVNPMKEPINADLFFKCRALPDEIGSLDVELVVHEEALGGRP